VGHDLESFRRVRASQSQPWEPSQTVPHLPRHALYSLHFCPPAMFAFPLYRYMGPSRWQIARGVVPSFHDIAPFPLKCVAMLRTPVRLFFFLYFSTADRSLLSNLPPLCLALPLPHPVAAPSPRVALTTSSPPRRPLAMRPLVASPLATCHPRRVPPLPRVPLLRRPLATRPLIALPLATRHPRRVPPSPRVPSLRRPLPRVTLVASPLTTRHSSRCVPFCGGNGGEVVSGWVGGNASAE
jgi:hypothetical protein